jgi:hypothetical protein
MRFISRLLALAALLLPTTLVVLTLHPGYAMADEIGCQVGNADAQQAWAQSPGTINVDVDLSDPNAVAAVQTAFNNWQASPAGQASGVTFNVQQLPLGVTPTGQYLVQEGSLPPGEAAVTDTVPSPQPDRTGATTTLNLGSGLDSDPGALERIMAHEIGHTFGLPDAFTNTITGLPCQPGTSVMGPMDPSNPSTSLTGPTADDSQKVITGDGYQKGTGTGGGGLPPCPRPYRPNLDGGCNPSPIIIDVDGSGYKLTDAAHGVAFDIFATGHPVQIAWTAAGSTNGFLVLDRNHDGAISKGTELFGDQTAQAASTHPNGFLALAAFDTNHDGVINARDPVFSQLRLWQDTDHNGIAEPAELHTLPQLGVTALSLHYQSTGRIDRYGNQFRYRAAALGTRSSRWAYDVFFTLAPDSTLAAFHQPEATPGSGIPTALTVIAAVGLLVMARALRRCRSTSHASRHDRLPSQS